METYGKDRLDRWFDSALQQYGRAEPRTGLEARILANLESSEQAGAGRRSRWALVPVAATASIAVALWVGIGTQHSTKQPIAASSSTGNPKSTAARENHPAAAVPRTVAHHADKHVLKRTTKVAKEPKLEQFPSPRPLTEQERFLKQYVEKFPDEAMLIAKVQTERQKELERLVTDGSSNSD